jgi:hypothetical protein
VDSKKAPADKSMDDKLVGVFGFGVFGLSVNLVAVCGKALGLDETTFGSGRFDMRYMFGAITVVSFTLQFILGAIYYTIRGEDALGTLPPPKPPSTYRPTKRLIPFMNNQIALLHLIFLTVPLFITLTEIFKGSA